MALNISVTKSYPFSKYELTEKELSEDEKIIYENIIEAINGNSVSKEMNEVNEKITRSFDRSKIGKIPEEADINALASILMDYLKDKVEKPDDFIAFILKKTFGGDLLIFLTDPDLEEIMITKDKPAFVYHRKHGACKTNIIMNEKEIYHLLYSLNVDTQKTTFTGKTLYGSRVTVTLPPISPPTITIRKFRKDPYSIIELIKNGSISTELTSFLWLCIDGMFRYPMNILFTGGSAGGKTTLLNALSVFIPPNERILTIEDTFEINLGERDYWVQFSSLDAEIKDLIKSAVRMRLERILLGEIRGEEAQELFSAMNIGARGIMATMHSDTAREAILRLQNRPMNVPKEIIPAVNLIIAVNYTFDRRKGPVRRISEVCEVSGMQEETVGLNQIFIWEQSSDTIKRTDLPSVCLETLSRATNMSIKELRSVLEERQELIEEAVKKDIVDFHQFKSLVESYYEKSSKN